MNKTINGVHLFYLGKNGYIISHDYYGKIIIPRKNITKPGYYKISNVQELPTKYLVDVEFVIYDIYPQIDYDNLKKVIISNDYDIAYQDTKTLLAYHRDNKNILYITHQDNNVTNILCFVPKCDYTIFVKSVWFMTDRYICFDLLRGQNLKYINTLKQGLWNLEDLEDLELHDQIKLTDFCNVDNLKCLTV